MKKSTTVLLVTLAFIGGGIIAFSIAGKVELNKIIKKGEDFNLPTIITSSENMIKRSYPLSGF